MRVFDFSREIYARIRAYPGLPGRRGLPRPMGQSAAFTVTVRETG